MVRIYKPVAPALVYIYCYHVACLVVSCVSLVVVE